MMLRICHLYGNMLNTYGDNGNLLMLQYEARQRGIKTATTLVSLKEPFNPDDFDFVFIGGGQDYEQSLVARDIRQKRSALANYIEHGGHLLAICGGFQLLGHYYETVQGEKLAGSGLVDCYTTQPQTDTRPRLIGDIEIYQEEFSLKLCGYENHAGRTFLGPETKPLGKVIKGFGNTETEGVEGCHYKNVYGTYLHGPFLVRNPQFTALLIDHIMQNKKEA